MNRESTENSDKLAANSGLRDLTIFPIYEKKNGVILWNRNNKETQTPLCNFSAQISQEKTLDDGAEIKRVFVITGSTADGKKLPTATFPSDQFALMNWIPFHWGTLAIVFAGQGTKDHLRVAIQLLSGTVPQHTHYTHLGWIKIGEKWVYLHSEGFIGEGESKITTSEPERRPTERLSSYSLPEPPTGDELKDAVQRSLSFLKLAPLRITAPMLAAVYHAPLGECYEIDFSIFLSGASGCQKSELSAMAQAHFGKNFKRTHLPGNWSSTANALERQAFLAKDTIFTVDDFAPAGTAIDVARLHKEADRLFRGQGNRAGRERLTAEAKAKQQYYPRGLIVSSGEDIPRGTSVRARICILEICRGDIDLDQLTSIQEDALQGQLAKAMSGYLQWLAPQIDPLKKEILLRQQPLRSETNLGAAHARTPDLIVSLGIGLDTFLRFALQVGALDSISHQRIWSECWKALQETGASQSEHHHVEDSASKFFELLEAAFVSGRAHLADSTNGTMPPNGNRWGWTPVDTRPRSLGGAPEVNQWQPKGDKIGWINGDEILLNPGAAFACAQQMARLQNDSIPTTANVLWKRLIQNGLAKKTESKKNLSKKTIEGERQRVLIIPNKDLLYGLRKGDTGGTSDESTPEAPSHPQPMPLKIV